LDVIENNYFPVTSSGECPVNQAEILVASQHALRTEGAAFIEVTFGVFEIAGAIAEE
jgi:hypothetical protein